MTNAAIGSSRAFLAVKRAAPALRWGNSECPGITGWPPALHFSSVFPLPDPEGQPRAAVQAPWGRRARVPGPAGVLFPHRAIRCQRGSFLPWPAGPPGTGRLPPAQGGEGREGAWRHVDHACCTRVSCRSVNVFAA